MLALLVACGGAQTAAPAAPRIPDLTLAATSGETASYPHDLAASPYTVFVFFSRDCLCFTAHQPRLRALVDRFGPRGVRFVIVDPESARTLDEDRREAATRQLPVPIFLDPGARLAHALGAEFATHAVVVDASGRVRYRGGLDSDKSHLRDDVTSYLADTLDDLTSGREPRIAEAKTLGCVLQTW